MPNQQTLCIKTNIFEQSATTNQQAGDYKVTLLAMQCQLESVV